MMLRVTLTLATAILAMSASHAAVTTSVSTVSTPGLEGFTTYTVKANATQDEGPIFGFDFGSNPENEESRGFFGPMNQVVPFGVSSIFRSNDDVNFIAATGGNPLQDSQFLLNVRLDDPGDPENGIPEVLGTNPFFASESNTTLRASVIEGGDFAFGSSFDFAQIVIADGDQVDYRGTIFLEGGRRQIAVSGVLGGVAIPEPSSVAVLLATIGFTGLRRRRRG